MPHGPLGTLARRIAPLFAAAALLLPQPARAAWPTNPNSLGVPLRSGAASFDGRDECHGSVGSAPCGRVLTFVAKAAYRSP